MPTTNSTSTSGTGTGSSRGGSRTSRLSENPVAALGAGFAVGAVLGAVIPAGQRERSTLQPLGLKMSEAARDAARQAAEAGRDKLNRVTGEVVTEIGSKVVDAVGGKEA